MPPLHMVVTKTVKISPLESMVCHVLSVSMTNSVSLAFAYEICKLLILKDIGDFRKRKPTIIDLVCVMLYRWSWTARHKGPIQPGKAGDDRK